MPGSRDFQSVLNVFFFIFYLLAATQRIYFYVKRRFHRNSRNLVFVWGLLFESVLACSLPLFMPGFVCLFVCLF